MGQPVTFKVFRFDPSRDHEPYWAYYTVEVEPGDVVLAALMKIREEQDGSLAFRASCRSGICGSDGMIINGRSRLACKTQVSDLLRQGSVITLEPLRNFPYVKDLVVDQAQFWEHFRAVDPWVQPDPAEPEPVEERRMILAPEAFDELSKASDCIFCGVCYSECPIVAQDHGYLGPQALIKAFRFEADPRDAATAARAPVVGGQQGVWRCRQTFNCTAACPKGIPVTRGILELRRKMVRFRLGGGRRRIPAAARGADTEGK
ncbi:MAG: succinate dehydrogenase iron-sulfur subunit [Firmicutes bacterium]|nr:succinate dehydrogenase iron-sulfur subunit [Bacillota bacterium]